MDRHRHLGDPAGQDAVGVARHPATAKAILALPQPTTQWVNRRSTMPRQSIGEHAGWYGSTARFGQRARATLSA